MEKLAVEVDSIQGQCPVYRKGDRFELDQGYQLHRPEGGRICMHALSSIMPFYLALFKGVAPERLGLQGPAEGTAYVQCPDPCDITMGGTVTFALKREE